MDAKRAASDILYMLGDNSTHSMIIIPKSSVTGIKQWLTNMKAVCDRSYSSNDMRWRDCVNQALFFADFSPELQMLVWTSRNEHGAVRLETVDAIEAILGDVCETRAQSATIKTCIFCHRSRRASTSHS